jgi:Cys-tRNA(Pro)/Cys-tRNA(Cys) deacylase
LAVSPLGQCSRIPVVTGASALEPTTIVCGAGRSGLEIEMATPPWVTTTAATDCASQ